MAVSPSLRHFILAVVFYHGFPIPSIKRGALRYSSINVRRWLEGSGVRSPQVSAYVSKTH